jgi:hypothetical protein
MGRFVMLLWLLKNRRLSSTRQAQLSHRKARKWARSVAINLVLLLRASLRAPRLLELSFLCPKCP